jgi:RNA-directed DNA polymerase
MSTRPVATPWPFQPPITQRHVEAEVAHCVGGVFSPVLANLFLHYAFDTWMTRRFPSVAFERYVDDVVVHCHSEAQAHLVAAAIAERMEQVGLQLHPDKTRIVYCKDGRRVGSAEHTAT